MPSGSRRCRPSSTSCAGERRSTASSGRIQPRIGEDVLAAITVDDNRDGIALTGEQDTAPKDMLAKAPSIERCASDSTMPARAPTPNALKCQTDRDYYDGPKQLNSDVAHSRQP
jgi:hypothetical protein